MMIWIFKGSLDEDDVKNQRSAFALMASVFLCLVPASSTFAQTFEEIQAYTRWSSQISHFNSSVIQDLALVQGGTEVINAYNRGEIDLTTAEQQLGDWRLNYQDRLDNLRDEALALAAGPEIDVASFEGYSTLQSLPVFLRNSIGDFYETADEYFSGLLAGEAADNSAFLASQYLVLASYTDGVARTKLASALAIDQSHPSHFQSLSSAANMRMTVLFMELVRQSLGAPPSRYAPTEFETAYESEIQTALAAIEAGEAALSLWREGVESESQDATGERLREYQTIIAILNVLDSQFVQERLAVSIHSEWQSYVDEDTSDVDRIAFLSDYGVYEAERDRLRNEAQRLVIDYR